MKLGSVGEHGSLVAESLGYTWARGQRELAAWSEWMIRFRHCIAW